MKTLSIHRVLEPLARTLAICALAASAVLITSSTSFACKCAPPPGPTEALAQASAVFEAQVAQLHPVELDLEVTFKVVRAWKGVDGETVRVRTRRDTAACGIPFETGKSYLVYAAQTTAQASSIALEALRCGRTRPAEEADEDFAVLGLGVVPVAPREPAADPTTPASPSAPSPSDSAPPTAAPKPPAAGGCASCSTQSSAGSSPFGALLALTALAFLLRRRR